MEIINNVYVSFVTAGKLNPDDYEHLKECNPCPPRFGRNWWTWIPDVGLNLFGNKNRLEMVDIRWLCYAFSITNYNLGSK